MIVGSSPIVRIMSGIKRSADQSPPPITLPALALATATLRFDEAWNFGPNESQNEISVKKLVELVIKEWGNGSWKITNGGGKEKKHESNILGLDSTKANKKLGWNPIYSLKEAIAETISWYKEYEGNKLKRSEITSSKIQNYVKKAKQSNLQWANP